MLTWGAFARQQPELAESGRSLLYQFGGVGLAFLGTVCSDGGPRVHPMCPILSTDHLFAQLIPSPKRADLLRDGRYALHSFPTDSNEDAFYLTGHALPVSDPETISAIRDQFYRERPSMDPATGGHDVPFEFLIEAALLTRTQGFGDSDPTHTIWRFGR